MNILRKHLFIAIFISLIITTFSACKNSSFLGRKSSAASNSSKSNNNSNNVEVGIVLPTKDEPRWLQDQKRFEKLLNQAGFSSEVVFSKKSIDIEKKNVENFIKKGIKILVICSNDTSNASDIVKNAKDAGIKVICYDRLITNTDAVDYYITFDSISVGNKQAQYIVDNIKKDKNIPLYLYAGSASDNNAFFFFKGAWEVLQPKIADGTFSIVNSSEANSLKNKKNLSDQELKKIVEEISTNWDFNKASELAKKDLQNARSNQKGNVAILAPNDGMSRSITDVFLNDNDIKSFIITGQDAEIASIQYIIERKQSMTVFKNTSILVSDTINVCVDILNNKKVNATHTTNNGVKNVLTIKANTEVVTKDNIKSTLIDSGYYDESTFLGLE